MPFNWYQVEVRDAEMNYDQVDILTIKALDAEAAATYAKRTTHWATYAKTLRKLDES